MHLIHKHRQQWTDISLFCQINLPRLEISWPTLTKSWTGSSGLCRWEWKSLPFLSSYSIFFIITQMIVNKEVPWDGGNPPPHQQDEVSPVLTWDGVPPCQQDGVPLHILTWDRATSPTAGVNRLKILPSVILRMRAVMMAGSLLGEPCSFLCRLDVVSQPVCKIWKLCNIMLIPIRWRSDHVSCFHNVYEF